VNDLIAELHQELEALRIDRERDRRAFELLRTISIACLGKPSARAIFEAIHQALQPVFGYDAAYFAVCDPNHREMFRAALLVDEESVEYLEHMPYGPLTGMLVRQRQPLLFHDLLHERDTLAIQPERFGNQQKRSRSWMGTPLLLGYETVGVISVQSYQPGVYDRDSLDLLQRIGNLLAVALENAALVEQQRALGDELTAQIAARTRELGTMTALAEELALQRPLSELLNRALFLLVEHLAMSGGAVRLLTPDGVELTLAAAYGFPPEYADQLARIPVAGSLMRTVIQERRPLILDDAAQSDHWQRVGLHYRSLIAVPLQIGDRVLGSLLLVNAQQRAIHEQEIEFVRAVGYQIAIAIENARLFAERERQVAELSALSDISQAASTTLELRTLLRHIARALARFMRADVFSVAVYDAERDLISDGLSIDEGEEHSFWQFQPPPPDSLTAWVLRHRRALRFDNLLEEIGRYPELRLHAIGAQRIASSWLGMPLIGREGQPIGVLTVQAYSPHAFDDRDERFLAAVARQVALHVQNVMLFVAEQEARRTADTLREVARVLSAAFSSGEVLKVILRELKTVIPYDSASIMLREGNMLRAAAVAPEHIATRLDTMNRPLNEPGAAVWVVKHKQPLLIEDVSASHIWVPKPRLSDIQSWIGVPLVVKGEVLGVLNIDSSKKGRFTQRDVGVAQVFADSAAIAIENARLYAESIARREQELEIARRIQSNLFPRELPRRHGIALAARCLPAREVGGDFFDCFALGERRSIAVMIGDASGKSVAGALLMAIARSVGRAEAFDHEEPALVLRETNRSVAHDVPRGTFVALCYATIDPSGHMAVANAGQLTPVLLHPNGALRYLYPPGPTLPLGIQIDMGYEALAVDLAPGDTVLFFTDGLVEAHNAAGELFGFERLDALLTAHVGLPPDALIDCIIAEVMAFIGNTVQHDDITLVVVQFGGDRAQEEEKESSGFQMGI
jgi:serine phosphatase RsbU (regulator of sigma subunit)